MAGNTVLECVVNISEGRDQSLVAAIAAVAGADLLDVHSDPDHNRSRADPRRRGRAEGGGRRGRGPPRPADARGRPPSVRGGRRRAVRAARRRCDGGRRAGPGRVRPLGVGDARPPLLPLRARARRCPRCAAARSASSSPTSGPVPRPHPTAGAVAVGARPVLVAYNLWVDATVDEAKAIARRAAGTRGARARASTSPSGVQVSCNLVEPDAFGPAAAYDVGRSAGAGDRGRSSWGWSRSRFCGRCRRTGGRELDLDADRTIEARLARR